MKNLLLVALVFTVQFSFGQTLKQIVDGQTSPYELQDFYLKSMTEYKIDSLDKLIFHVPNFKNDYSLEKHYFKYRGKKEIDPLKIQSEKYNSVWKSVNQRTINSV